MNHEIILFKPHCFFIAIMSSHAFSNTKIVPLGGTNISIIAPKNFCFLDVSHPFDRRIHDVLTQMFAKNSLYFITQVIGCNQQAEWRSQRIAMLRNYGQYLTPLTRLNQKAPFSRERFTAFLCKSMKKLNQTQITGFLTEAKKVVENTVKGLKMNNQKSLGALFQDKNACFFGTTVTLKLPSGSYENIIGVTYSTLIKGKMIQFNLYTKNEGDKSLQRLLRQQKANVAQLIAANQ